MTRYEHGFLTKCAEHGVDGRPLLKKIASTAGHELAGYTVTSMIPYLGSVPNAIGQMIGGVRGRDLTDDEREEFVKDREGDNASNYIPGVAGYRMAVRAGQMANAERDLAQKLGKKHVRPVGVTMSEGLGTTLNPINWVASPIGALIAAGKKHRTLEEQVNHDKKIQWIKNLLLPGYAGYHNALRLGASRDVMDPKKKKDDEKKED